MRPSLTCRTLIGTLASIAWLIPGAAVALDLVEVVKLVEPAVVRVDTNRGLGSGVIVDDRGLVLTNFHVIDGASQVKLTLRSGKTLEVSGFLAVEPTHDLALLKSEELHEPHAIGIAVAAPQIGEKVAAFGNPRGFDFTTSEGIVSAIRSGRKVSESLGPETYRALGYDLLATWIQTTAPISPGNSGGPLVNMKAELVGLNTWNYPGGQNLNFAISASDINRLLVTAQGAPVQGFARLPNLRGRPLNPPSISRERKDFKFALPSGRVFSFRAFLIEIPRVQQASVENGDGVAVMKHSNGSVYAAASQVGGVLDGVTVAQYDNREPMVFATYADGKRHGVLTTFNEAGKPVYFAQYVKGKPHGFSAFFEDDDLRVIAEHENGELKWFQLMAGEKPLEGFSDRAAAEKNSGASDLLKKVDKVEATLKTNELAFKKQVKDYNIRLRKVMSGRAALEKRKQTLAEINKENSANAAFHAELMRKAVSGRW